jgi:hypothetical protein
MNKKYDTIWEESLIENIRLGLYGVKMLDSRWFGLPIKWFMNTFRDKKIINSNFGYNKLIWFRWGYFEYIKTNNSIDLIYENGFILDQVRKHKDYYIGKFNLKISKRIIFIGWFSLKGCKL